MKKLHVVPLMASALLFGCVAATANQPSNAPALDTAQSEQQEFNHQKILDAISYLEREIAVADNNRFRSNRGQALDADAKNEFLQKIRNERSRLSKLPSGVYIAVSRALQDGLLFAPCSSGGTVNLDCIDFNRLVTVSKRLDLALEVSKEADTQAISHVPLARHYQNGWGVKKSLSDAYLLLRREASVQKTFNFEESAIRMMQSELKNFDPSLKTSGQMDANTCKIYSAVTSNTECSAVQMREMFAELDFEKLYQRSKAPTQDLLKQDWISENPILLGRIPIRGFQLDKEGIMYVALNSGKVRALPSSFDYEVNGRNLKFTIKFSSVGLQVGSSYIFEVGLINDQYLLVKYQDQERMYRKQ